MGGDRESAQGVVQRARKNDKDNRNPRSHIRYMRPKLKLGDGIAVVGTDPKGRGEDHKDEDRKRTMRGG